MTILCKQTSGFVFAGLFVIYKAFRITQKEQIKEYAKIAGLRLLGILIPTTIFLIYINVVGAFSSFLDYTVKGIGTFPNTVSYIQLFEDPNWFVKILAFIVPVQIVVMGCIIKLAFQQTEIKEKEWYKAIIPLLIYSVGAIPVIIPIADRVHFCIGALCTIISLIYSVNIIIQEFAESSEEKKQNTQKIIQMIACGIATMTVFSSLSTFATYIQNINSNDIKHLKYIPTGTEYTDEISQMKELIEKKESERKNCVHLGYGCSNIYDTTR